MSSVDWGSTFRCVRTLFSRAIWLMFVGLCTAHAQNFNPNNFDSAKIMQAFYNPHSDLVLISAHRGIHALAGLSQAPYVPENSLQAVGYAAQEGWETVEVDVRLTSDGVPILSHDQTWGREWCGLSPVPVSQPYDPFSSNTGYNASANPSITGTSLSNTRSFLGNTVLRDSVSLLSTVTNHGCNGYNNWFGVYPPTLQDAYNYIRDNDIQTVLIIDVQSPDAAKAAWAVTTSNVDAKGRPSRQSTIYKMPAGMFPSPADFKNLFQSGYSGMNFIPVITSRAVEPVNVTATVDEESGGFDVSSAGTTGFGSEQNIVNWINSFESDGTISMAGIEVVLKESGGILTSVLSSAQTRLGSSAPMTIGNFNPVGEYYPNGTGQEPQFFRSKDGSCCDYLEQYLYNNPNNTGPLDPSQPMDRADNRRSVPFVVGTGANFITTDDPNTLARYLTSNGLNRRNISYMQANGGASESSNAVTVSLSTVSSSVTSGENVGLWAVLGPSYAVTGSVTFMDGSIVLGTVPVSNGTSEFTWVADTVGTHNMYAVYSGDGAHPGTQSNTLSLVVAPPRGSLPPEQTQPATTSNPQPGAFMNHSALLGNVNDPDWFLNNIPFFEIPDTAIQQVYYYRWQTYKEHLVYTTPTNGWLSTEFLLPVGYGAPYGGIDAAAGHQITEGRWLRTQQYDKDIINYWLNGPGQTSKPQDDGHNADTADWAHEYSFWAGSAVWQWYLATGDQGFVTGLLPQLVNQYRGWDNHFNSSLGLYWQYPVWDATEYTPASYESSDPYHGGAGYRPTINAYQYGDATAIANIANLAGNGSVAAEYRQRATALQSATLQYLWDPNRTFFFHMNRDNNPNNALLDTREEEGFVPWMFDLPQAAQAAQMSQLLDPQGFNTAYGPPTVEKRSSWYMYQASSGCCHWTGPSWPYETSQTLTGLANLLIDYPAQSTIGANDYVTLLDKYAQTQYRGGAPYVAEAHDPDNNDWIYDTYDHSEDYNHSTYIDNIISGLIGLRGQSDNTLKIAPLAPASWDYFALENVPYHGHLVAVLWDRLGTRYGQGQGLTVLVDNNVAVHQSNLNPVTVQVGSALTQTSDGLYDIAVNSQRTSYGPQPIASYVFSPVDSIWNGIDGITYRTGIPEDSRWTSYNALSNATNYYGVDLHGNYTVQEVRLTFYDDGGNTRAPSSYNLQYWDNLNGWVNLPTVPAIGDEQIRIQFAPVTTSKIRVTASNQQNGNSWGISELQVMSPSPGVQAVSDGAYEIINYNSNKMLGVHNESPFDGAQIQQYEDDGTPDHVWIAKSAGNGSFILQNLATGKVLGIDQESTADSALAKQAPDNGTPDHLWTFIPSNGAFKIQNQNSGKLLAVDHESTANSANVVQFSDTGTSDHLWIVEPIPDPRGIGSVKWINYNSGKALAVQDESVADSAQIQQFTDTVLVNEWATPDHLWYMEDQGGGAFKIRNVMSRLMLGIDHMSTADSADAVQFEDNQTPDHLWTLIPVTASTAPNVPCYNLENVNSGLLLGVDQMSTADHANVVQFHDNGTNDHVWCMVNVFNGPDIKPVYKIFNLNSGKVLAVQDKDTDSGAQIQQYSDTGTNDQAWQLVDAGGGYFKIVNLRSNLVLGVDQMSTADSALIKQAPDNGTDDHLWQLIDQGNDQYKIKNKLSSLLLGIDQMSTADSANVVQFEDNGTADHIWHIQATGWPSQFR